MRRFCAIFFLLFVSVFLKAQGNLSVASFVMSDGANPANLSGTIVRDQNGDKCALIRVQTTQTGFTWDFGQMAPVKIIQKTGEIWIYVPYGVKRVTIRHAQLGSGVYEFPIPIEKARTYMMDLVTANIITIVEKKNSQQWLVVNVTPKSALVTVDGVALENNSGIAKKFLRLGLHSCKVSCSDYFSETMEVNMTDTENATRINIDLKPAFALMTISNSESSSGAAVYVDDKMVGNVPLSGFHLSEGIHEIRFVKPKYKSLAMTVDAVCGKDVMVEPVLAPFFTDVTLKSQAGSEIWANGELLGDSPWSGTLEYGDYTMEVRQKSHKTVYREVQISENGDKEIVLPNPIPIYGSLNIDCSNCTADVLVDGKKIGKTPLFRNNILVGPHTVTLVADGYSAFQKIIQINEEETEPVEVRMSKSAAPEKVSVGRREPARIPESEQFRKFTRQNCVLLNAFPTRYALKGGESDDSATFLGLSFGYRHNFVKSQNILGFSLGSDLAYLWNKEFDCKLFSIYFPVDMVIDIDYVKFNLGLNAVANIVSGDSDAREIFKPLGLGFQTGIRVDLGGFCLSYNYVRGFTSSDSTYPIFGSSHSIGLGFWF